MPVPPLRLFGLLPAVLAAGLLGCGEDESKLPKIGRASLIDCGGKWLRIPPPPEMIRSDSIHPEWDAMLAASLPPGQKLLGYYTTFEDRVRIERQAPPASDRDCILHIREKDIDRDLTSWGLGGLEDDIDDEIDQVIDDLGVQLAAAIATGSVQADGDQPAAATGGSGSLLGWFGETDHSFGYSIAIDVNRGEGAQAGTISMVSSTVVALVNGRMLSFQATTSEAGATGQAWAEKTASTWSRLAMSANPEYDAPSWIWRGIKLIIFIGLVYGANRGVRYLIQLKKKIQEEIAEEEAKSAFRDGEDDG